MHNSVVVRWHGAYLPMHIVGEEFRLAPRGFSHRHLVYCKLGRQPSRDALMLDLQMRTRLSAKLQALASSIIPICSKILVKLHRIRIHATAFGGVARTFWYSGNEPLDSGTQAMYARLEAEQSAGYVSWTNHPDLHPS